MHNPSPFHLAHIALQLCIHPSEGSPPGTPVVESNHGTAYRDNHTVLATSDVCHHPFNITEVANFENNRSETV